MSSKDCEVESGGGLKIIKLSDYQICEHREREGDEKAEEEVRKWMDSRARRI
jgi:hypothetical protein